MKVQTKCHILKTFKKYSREILGVSAGIGIGGAFLYSQVLDDFSNLPAAIPGNDNPIILNDLTIQAIYSIVTFSSALIIYFVSKYFYGKCGCNTL